MLPLTMRSEGAGEEEEGVAAKYLEATAGAGFPTVRSRALRTSPRWPLVLHDETLAGCERNGACRSTFGVKARLPGFMALEEAI